MILIPKERTNLVLSFFVDYIVLDVFTKNGILNTTNQLRKRRLSDGPSARKSRKQAAYMVTFLKNS